MADKKRTPVTVDPVLWDAILTALQEARAKGLVGYHCNRAEHVVTLRLDSLHVNKLLLLGDEAIDAREREAKRRG